MWRDMKIKRFWTGRYDDLSSYSETREPHSIWRHCGQVCGDDDDGDDDTDYEEGGDNGSDTDGTGDVVWLHQIYRYEILFF